MSVSPTYTYTITSPKITLPEPVKKKYIFKGWYTTANFTGKQMTAISPGSYGNVTFYAKWEKAAPATGGGDDHGYQQKLCVQD